LIETKVFDIKYCNIDYNTYYEKLFYQDYFKY